MMLLVMVHVVVLLSRIRWLMKGNKFGFAMALAVPMMFIGYFMLLYCGLVHNSRVHGKISLIAFQCNLRVII